MRSRFRPQGLVTTMLRDAGSGLMAGESVTLRPTSASTWGWRIRVIARIRVRIRDGVALGEADVPVDAFEVGMADRGAHGAHVFAAGVEDPAGDRGDPFAGVGAAGRAADGDAFVDAHGQVAPFGRGGGGLLAVRPSWTGRRGCRLPVRRNRFSTPADCGRVRAGRFWSSRSAKPSAPHCGWRPCRRSAVTRSARQSCGPRVLEDAGEALEFGFGLLEGGAGSKRTSETATTTTSAASSAKAARWLTRSRRIGERAWAPWSVGRDGATGG